MSNTIEIICAIISVVATVIIGTCQICQSRRDERRHRDHCESEASRFLQTYREQYKDDKRLKTMLELCAVAYCYDCKHPYKKPMFRDFCSLTKDVRKLIIDKYDISEHSLNTNIEKEILIVAQELSNKHPGDESAASVFEIAQRALKTSSEEKLPANLYCQWDSIDNNEKIKSYDEKIFLMRLKNHIKNVCTNKSSRTPISDVLKTQVSDNAYCYNPKDINTLSDRGYVICECLFWLYYNEAIKENYQYLEYNSNFEELFLSALFCIIHRQKKEKQKKTINTQKKFNNKKISKEEIEFRSLRINHVYKIIAATFAILAGCATIIHGNKSGRKLEFLIMITTVSSVFLCCLLKYLFLDLSSFRCDLKTSYLKEADKSYSRLWIEIICLLISNTTLSIILYSLSNRLNSSGIPVLYVITMSVFLVIIIIDSIPALKRNNQYNNVFVYTVVTGFSLFMHVLISMMIYAY